ncbi:RNA polymerase sigma factor [Aquimarina sp. 2-A2]|uniref:RNA polymerase sigma factor n=1 Tax=Aquimarina sp. 2-A2 TaxID=3382644 RepID=UPI00387EF08E
MGNRKEDKENELIIRARNGDSKAFRTLVDIHKDKSLSLALSIIKNKSLAEDILQEVFIKVHRNLGRFKFKSKFSTWLYKIVVNTCNNELRRHKNNISIEESEVVINLSTKRKDNQILLLQDQKEYIQKAMEQLKMDEALVIRLFYLCEMSLKEIEIITKFSTSKIRVDLHRGRKNLHLILKQLLGDEIDNLL